MVKVAVEELVFPQSSVAVKVTVAAPFAPHKSLKVVKLFVHDASCPQALDTLAPPLLFSQFCSCC